MRVHHNGVFKNWPDRIYEGGQECQVDYVGINEILIDELDALMTQIGYAEVETNYYYFVKPGSTLDNGLYSFREAVNLDLLKDIVKEHKLIDVYVEIGKTMLELSKMSTVY